MPRKQFILLFALLVSLVIIGILLVNRSRVSKIITPSPSPSEAFSSNAFPSLSSVSRVSSKPSISATPQPPLVSQVKIYLVAINDQGKTGIKVGCGDSIVAVTQYIPPTTMPLTSALQQLLGLTSQYYGQSGLYNALYQSTLQVDSVSVNNGVATVHLSGTLKLGGECDNPRVEAQLTQTVMQFPTVKQANIYINNQTLKDALSLK